MVINNYLKNTQKCLSCGENKELWELIESNRTICNLCVTKHKSSYEMNKKEGKHNSPILWCQDCQSQFEIFDAKHTDPFTNYNDFEQAVRVCELIPYHSTPLYLTRWKCNCEDKKPILTVGMPYFNWKKGFIKKHNKKNPLEKKRHRKGNERNLKSSL